MSARRGFNAAVFAMLAVCVGGCSGCPLEALLPRADVNGLGGAKLVSPPTATAGTRITLDASGGEIATAGSEGPCPVLVSFYARFEGEPADKEPIATLTRPRGAAATTNNCRLVDAKVRVTVPGAPRVGSAKLIYTVLLQAIDGSKPVGSRATSTTVVTTAPGQTAPPPPANRAPVAKLFANVQPAVQGRPIDLDARESFDPREQTFVEACLTPRTQLQARGAYDRVDHFARRAGDAAARD